MLKNELLVVYETMEKKEILIDRDALFIPRKGDHINFKGLLSNLLEWEKEKVHKVEEVEFKLPEVIIIRVYSL